MNSLKTYKFSDLYQMSSGISSTPKQAGHGSPFLSFSAVFGNYFLPEKFDDLMQTSDLEQKKYSILEGDIFLTRTSETIDELGMSSVAVKNYPNATYSGFLKRLRPTQKNVTYHKFMGFYLRSKLFRKTMENNAVLTLRASLNEDIFSYLNLIIPEYNEQVKIGDLLYLLNQKIDLNNRINFELEKMAKAIYDYWFVQFDFPDKNDKPYKSSGGKFFYDSGLKFKIPQDWTAKRILDLSPNSTNTINPAVNPDKNFKHFSIPEFDKTGSYKIEKGKEIGSNKYAITGYDLLVSKLNPWFNRVIYPFHEEELICSTEFVVWRTDCDEIKNHLYLASTNTNFINFCIKSATGTSNSHKRISPYVMMGYLLPFNEKVVLKFGKKIDPIIKKIFKNKKENQELQKLRDWLLPMLMNGQVKVN